jgi:hypothetical protein
MNGTYFRGGTWISGKLFTNESCTGSGACSDPRAKTQADCEASYFCNANPEITDPDRCAAIGYCSDEFYTDWGSCVFPFEIDSITGMPFCSRYLPGAAGCVDFALMYDAWTMSFHFA